MSFQVLNIAIRAAVAAAVAYTALTHFSLVSTVILVLSLSASAVWLWRSRAELQAKASVQRQRALDYVRTSSQPWKKPTDSKIIILLLLSVGAILLYETYNVHSDPGSRYLVRFVYSFIGYTGTVIVSSFMAISFLALGVEALLVCEARKGEV